MPVRDPYVLDPALVEDPPRSWPGTIKMLGPGFVLTASIVGSGELIATTTLGAKAGFVALWVILLSCLVKVTLQLEFGRHTILTGETALAAFNLLPGLKLRGVHWTTWFWLAVQPLKILQVSGVVGAVAILLHDWLPSIPTTAWCWIVAISAAVMVSSESYRFIERACVLMIVAFTATTLVSVVSLYWTDYAVTGAQLADGFRFQLPEAAMVTLLGAFGLTGVGGDEIMQYTYWLIEKGYAAKTGHGDHGDPVWRERAKGWIRVMYLDALASMVVYTVITAAFYVLGAAVLHARGDVPAGDALIQTLTRMYTESLGPWARGVFLTGGFFVLYSTVFSALAAWTRTFADAAGRFGMINFDDAAARRRAVVGLAWFFPTAWAALFMAVGQPVDMVTWGGVATAAILIVVVVAAIDFRWRRTPAQMRPGPLYDAALVFSIASLAAFAAYTAWSSAGRALNPTPAKAEIRAESHVTPYRAQAYLLGGASLRSDCHSLPTLSRRPCGVSGFNCRITVAHERRFTA
jgi:manganese transport protein